MTIAIWDYPAAELLVSGLSREHTVLRDTPRHCAALLEDGAADVALLSTLSVLRSLDRYEVCAGVALSSWRYPYARLVLKEPLGPSLDAVAFDPAYAQEVLLARIALKEHYRFEPAFVPYDDPSNEELLAADEPASLIVGPRVPFIHPDEYAMDLGQEWYELTQYPMVWGLFAMRAGEGDPATVALLVEGAHRAQSGRNTWLQSQETTPDLHRFYRDDVRIHLDDMATAGLTSLREHLFYYDVVDEMSAPHFIEAPDSSEPHSDDTDFHR